MGKIKIALLQIPVAEEKETNIETAKAYVKKAARQGAQIAVLPEMFCCPYRNAAFVKNAEPEGGYIWQSLSRMAAENQLLLIGGSMPEKEGEHLYNTSFVFDKEGKQLAKHRKVHLFDIHIRGKQAFRESATFTPGSRITVFDSEFGKIGLEICFDIRFTELTHAMALQGARLVFVPAAFNLVTGPAHWQLHFRARAVDSQIFMAGCAPARDMQASYHSYGHSIVTSPWGEVLNELDENEGMLLQEIDLQEVASIREQLPILSARRTDIYSLSPAEK